MLYVLALESSEVLTLRRLEVIGKIPEESGESSDKVIENTKVPQLASEVTHVEVSARVGSVDYPT